ncbi:MAG: efflux RND transporter periplasmic adaptor subunit [Bacteroidota bacterium]
MMTTPLRPLLGRAYLLLCVNLLLLPGCGKHDDQSQSTIGTDVPVSVSGVKRQKLESSLSLVGNINASADVNVISETQGTVTAVRVKVGTAVKAGAVLVEVDDEIPRSTQAAAEINFQKARRDYQRAEELYTQNSISASQLDASRLAMKAAENQLDIARRQVENTRIKSPIAGTVNSRFVDLGTMVQPGKAVANIVDISTLKVRVNVSEREAFQLHPGDMVEISTDVYPGVAFEGTIDNIASKADDAHTYPVEIVVANSQKHPLKAGLFARIAFKSIAPTETLTIPRLALIGSIKDAQVFVVRGNVAALQSVVIGKQSTDFYEVASGLSEGDTVVVGGQNNLVDQTRIQIVNRQY